MNLSVLSVLSSLSMLILILSSMRCMERAWAFSYPTTPATPEGHRTLKVNLFKLYHQELSQLKKHSASQVRTLFSKQETSVCSKTLGTPSPEYLRRLSSEIHFKNQTVLETLSEKLSQPSSLIGTRSRVAAITRDQAQEILDSVALHPVVGEKSADKYDPERFNIGFCFGRATYLHLELLRRGVSPASIRKIFAIGHFLFQGQPWDYHVVTLVRGRENQWWALDNATSTRVEPVEGWMKNVEKLDKNYPYPQVRFYSTDAVKFQPWEGAYSSKNLHLPYFHHYFKNLAKWFDDHPVSKTNLFD